MNTYTYELEIQKNKSLKNMLCILKNSKTKCYKYVLNETKHLCVYFFQRARKAGHFIFYVKQNYNRQKNPQSLIFAHK